MNAYTEYWKKIEALPEELKKIVTENWDYTGRPMTINTESNVIIQILNKNAAAGFPGFKLDMNRVFEKETFNDHQLGVYYNVFVAGAEYIKNRMIEGNKNTNQAGDTSKKLKM